MRFVYNLGIRFYYCAILISSLWNTKARRWIIGRRNWRQNEVFTQQDLKGCYWFHCASLGEFEQGRPLIEALRKQNPTKKIVLTFFSPSGYEIRKNYEGADIILYLPLDTPKNARDFIQLIQPEKAFFIKYEFWANYLFTLKNQGISTYCISGLFRKEQRFFKSTDTFFKQVLGCFTHFFLQNQISLELLQSIGLTNVTLTGDTRFDRVLANASSVKSNTIIERFKDNDSIFVIGSSWAVDEDLLIPLIHSNTISSKIIIAPHEINENAINELEQRFQIPCKRYTKCDASTDFSSSRVLIIDCIGLLSSIYSYGDIAYVGGAFGKGLHNILEPAVFGLPVIFGPKHSKFPEANLFIQAGIGFSIDSTETFNEAYHQILNNTDELNKKAVTFIQSQAGATNRIIEKIIK
jgi:3-deoxy-D-manno-octulosonic-acid transferase